MNFFPNESYPHWRSDLVRSPILQICRTLSSMWDLWNSWWNFHYPWNFSHECRRIHRCSHEHSPNHWLLFSWSCNVRHFLSFSHLIFYFNHKFCCVTSHDENFGICLFVVISTIRLPRSIMNHLFVPYGMRISVEKRFFTMRANLLPHIPRSFLKFPRSIGRRNLPFPLLRRPRTMIIQFWVSCWRESIRLPRSIIYHNRFPKIFIFVPCLPRAWWSRRRHDRWHPRCQIHHKSWICCDSFFSWFLLNSLCHGSRTNCRTEMANFKHAQQMIPLIVCDILFG